MSETILIFDNDNFDRAKASAAQIVKAGSNAVFVYEGVDYDSLGNRTAQQSRQVDLVLFHQRNETELNAAAVCAPCRISYSGGPGADIIRTISHDGLTTDEARHIITQLRSGTLDLRDRILAYWSGRGSLFALRLLCEAYAMPTVGFGSKSYTPQATGVAAIAVRCPEPCTWFDLVGATPPKSDMDAAAINAFGRLMGDAGDVAMDLARAIVQPGGDISGLAGKFVEKVTEITATQAGGRQ